MFYFSTYCANCFLFNEGGEQCFETISWNVKKVVSSVLLFNLLFQLLLFNEGGVQCFTFQLIVRIVFLFNEGGEQCFTFQLIVSIVFVKVVCSVLLFNLLCELFLWRWCAVFYFSNLLCELFLFIECGEQCFTFQLIVSIVLFNGGGVQCFTFQLIVQIVFCLMKLVSSVLLFNLLCELFFV